jgi:hypothetical protein
MRLLAARQQQQQQRDMQQELCKRDTAGRRISCEVRADRPEVAMQRQQLLLLA